MMLVFLMLILFFGVWYSARYKNPVIRKTFLYSLTLKLFGGIAVCLIYIFIYKYGDTFRFFKFGLMYRDILLYSDEYSFFEALFLSNDRFKDTVSYKIDYSYGYAESSLIINKISGIISIFTFDSFFATTLIFSLLSFSGVWKLYITISKLYPKLYKDLAIAILFFPSVVFWGSGLLKDSICIGGLGWITWGVYGLLFDKENHQSKLMSVIAAVVSFWLVLNIKAYVAVSFVAGLSLWIVLNFRDKIENQILRFLVLPLLLAIMIPAVLVSLSTFSEELGRYALENVIQTALDQSYNLQKDLSAGSTYSLGSIDPSIAGMLSKAPAAINVTLFRPYPWEVSNTIMVAAMFESLLLLFLVVYLFYKSTVYKILYSFLNNGFVIFCISYSLTFSFFVGLSSGNFGSLVRYKIPAIPFFITGLVILYYLSTGRTLVDSLWHSKRKMD